MSEKDIQISYAAGFEALVKVLASARRPGSWHASGVLETAMPTIEVAGVGKLSFPTPPAQARQLIEAAERAPYGKGDLTLVDENVRKVWQISPGKLKVSGKGWSSAFKELVKKIGEDLGCEGVAIEAQFYKLLVYERGSFFLSHRDSEKADGMFGTLVVNLPSEHEGGELVVRHAGREAVFDLSGSGAPSEIQFAAFYADCEHEVRPVRAGFRVSLIYNLVRKERKPLTPPDHRGAIAAAAPLLAQWASGEERPDKIVYLLEHHYTQAELSFSALKGADAALAQVLAPSAAEAGCATHLGIVHIEESGWAEYTGDGHYGGRYRGRWDDDEEEEEDDGEFSVGEVCDGSYYIDQWRAVDDAPVDFGPIPIGKKEILPPGALDDETPDESHFSEATGNEGASFERTYLRAALVIWPENRFDGICASAGPDAALARLEQLIEAEKKASGEQRRTAQEAVGKYARNLPPLNHLDDYGDSAGEKRLSRLLDALRSFGDADLMIEAAEPRLLEFYTGSENEALLAAVPTLDEKGAAALLAAVIRKRGPRFPVAILDLWTSMAEKNAESRALLDPTLDALLEAIRRHSPAKAATSAPWSRYRDWDSEFDDEDIAAQAPHTLTAAKAQAFLAALHASVCLERIGDTILGIIDKPDLFSPEAVILPALENLTLPVEDGPIYLWAHCAHHYLRRSEKPPREPADWEQSVALEGSSPLIRELETFARDPQARVHRFRVRKELRQVIHRAIDAAGLDMTHVTERGGSPQTLVCTKTRATYERACKQYRSDLSDMRRLLALSSMLQSEDNIPLAQRLRRAAEAR